MCPGSEGRARVHGGDGGARREAGGEREPVAEGAPTDARMRAAAAAGTEPAAVEGDEQDLLWRVGGVEGSVAEEIGLGRGVYSTMRA